jgi:hypothetical protein
LRYKDRHEHRLKAGWYALGYALGFLSDFRRTADQNMERAEVPRSVAKALGGWKCDSIYNRYTIDSEADLRQGVLVISQGDLVRMREKAKR